MAEQKKPVKNIIKKIFRDKNGNIVIGQRPNTSLIIWVVCAVLGYFISYGVTGKVLDYLGTIAIIFWALLEIFYGVNIFRRILGIVVIALVIFI